MNNVISQEEQALHAQIEQVRRKLDTRALDLKAVDGELTALAVQRQRYQLLEQACVSVERLAELGAADWFWGEHVAADQGAEFLRHNRQRLQGFQEHLGKIESRRQSIVDCVAQEEAALELLEDDLYQAEEQDERRRLEWVVEREAGPVPMRQQVMAWERGGAEDQRFRKTLAASLLLGLLLGGVLPMIDLPLPKRGEPIEVPERLVQLVQERARPVPLPPAPEEKPKEQKPDPRDEQKPKEQERPVRESETQLASAPAQAPQKKAEPAGILAFREKFSSLRQSSVSPRLGLQARISNSDDNTAGITQRSMLTKLGPGSSGGINLAGLSRDVGGGGGGGGGMQGVAVTRATSGIGGSGTADRPLSGDGLGLARTDEEIQIVFDRYKAALYRLYNRELRKDPSLRGQMVLRLTIEPNGSVSFCQLQSSDMNAPELSAQVVERVSTFDFGAKEVGAITIVYPIDFLPAA